MNSQIIAVTHASGLLAEALLEVMAESGINADNIILLDQQQHIGNRLAYGDTYLSVQDQQEYDYEDLLAVLLLEPDEELESLLQHADCFVISHHADAANPSVFFPEFSDLPEHPGAIKLPSAELSSLLLVVNAIHSNYLISSLHTVNVLSSSIYGKSGIDELASQTISLLNSQDVNSKLLPLQLAFNMIPVEPVAGAEYQLQSALRNSEINCSVQNIVVAAFHGLSISVSLETENDIDIDQLIEIINSLDGVQLSSEQIISPLTHCKTDSDVIITGLYHPQKVFNKLQFWIVADSVKNGLLLNYQNMLEILLKSFL